MTIYKGLTVYKGYVIEYWTSCYVVRFNGEEIEFKTKTRAREFIDDIEAYGEHVVDFYR